MNSKFPQPGFYSHCSILGPADTAHDPPSFSVPFLRLILPSELSLSSCSVCQIPSILRVMLRCRLLCKTLPNSSDQRDPFLFGFLLCIVCSLPKSLFAHKNKINAWMLARAEFPVYTVHLQAPSEVQEHKFSFKEIDAH